MAATKILQSKLMSNKEFSDNQNQNAQKYHGDEQILILAPTGRDAKMTAQFFGQAGLTAEICRDVIELCQRMSENAGLIFLTGEALTPEMVPLLVEALTAQPAWSDIPLIVLTSGGGDTPFNEEALAELNKAGNVTLIERPVRLTTLVSGVNSSLRARRRQYEARDYLIAESKAKEALKQSETQLLIALDAARLGSWQFDLATGAFDCTNICKANYGLPPDAEFSYPQLLQMIHPDDREVMQASVQRAIEEDVDYKAEYRVTWADGTLHWIQANGRASYDIGSGKPENMVGVTLDITHRKLAESEREELLKSERAARSEAEAASRLKDEFLATVSHELRTPLNAMLGWTSLLRAGNLGSEEMPRALEVIERNARSQAKIIEDLLDVSRIITGKLNLEIKQFDAAGLIKAVIESVAPAAAAKEINIRQNIVAGDNFIYGDAARLQQVLWNLLTNSIKFTPPGGRIELKLHREDSNLIIAVSDTGKGIAAEFLPHVFDRFRQADGTTTRHFGGLGLGLAIVRHLVEQHGGTVAVASDGENKGATFTIKLPFAASLQTKSEPLQNSVQPPENGCPKPANGLDGLNILVVDDEIDTLEMLKIFLESSGAKVTAANSVAEALENLQTDLPDVIISDIGMPGVNGYQFMENIRELSPERGGKIPAVALTAYARNEDKQRALRSGYQTHVAKPVEINSLVSTIASVVNQTTERGHLVR